MADRFPSIEDIDAGETSVRADAPSGDFLERERAVLGDDAELFSAAATDSHAAAARVEEDDGDLLGGDGGEETHHVPAAAAAAAAAASASKDDDINGFESAFPAISTTNDAVGPGGAVTSSAAAGGYTNYNAPTHEEDSEPVRAWREKRDADIARREEASQRKKAETVATAQKDIDAFYDSYNRKVDRQKAQVAKEAEDFLARREDTTAGGTSWERIARLVDLSGKGQSGGGDGSSKRRMRDLLLSLKADKAAPGVAGV